MVIVERELDLETTRLLYGSNSGTRDLTCTSSLMIQQKFLWRLYLLQEGKF